MTYDLANTHVKAEARPLLVDASRTTKPATMATRKTCLMIAGSAASVVLVAGLVATKRLGLNWDGVEGVLLAPAPDPARRAGVGSTVRFTMYDHCMPKEVKEEADSRDFWSASPAGGKIVRHNYGSHNFFKYDDGIELTRTEISDGLYAWTADTNQVDFEYGFALSNERGEYFYEIGTEAENAPLVNDQGAECVQRYGEYFNRVRTLEKDYPSAASISYVFGTCNSTCAEGYEDTAYDNKPLGGRLVNGGTVDLGPQTDARLVIPETVMMYGATKDKDTGINPPARVGLQKDTSFTDTKNAVRWIVGTVDYWRMYLKLVKIEIFIENGTAKMQFISQKRHTFDNSKGYYNVRFMSMYDWRPEATVNGVTNIFTDPTYYDLTQIFNDPTNVDMDGNYVLQSLAYKSLQVGDSPAESLSVEGIDSEPSCKTSLSGKTCTAAEQASSHFLPGNWNTPAADGKQLLFAAGEWGPDLDARRVIVNAGAICSLHQNMGNCMYAAAQPFKPADGSSWSGYSGPTKTRKQWVFASLVGVGWKMVRIEIFVENGALYARALDSALDSTMAAADYDHNTGDSLLQDISQRYRNPTHGPYYAYRDWNGATFGTNGEAMNCNMGGIYYSLASSMRPSLTGYGAEYSLNVDNVADPAA